MLDSPVRDGFDMNIVVRKNTLSQQEACQAKSLAYQEESVELARRELLCSRQRIREKKVDRIRESRKNSSYRYAVGQIRLIRWIRDIMIQSAAHDIIKKELFGKSKLQFRPMPKRMNILCSGEFL